MRSRAGYVAAILTALAALFLFAGASVAADAADQVNINTADKARLKTLNGVGDALADRILDYRKKNGSFKKPEDIQNVKGIGPATFKKNKSRIIIGTPEPVKAAPKTTPKAAPKSQDKPKS